MGVDWKIFKPKEKIKTQEFIHSVKSLVNEFPEASVKLSSTKRSKDEIQKLNRLQLAKIDEYNGTIKTKNKQNFLELFKSKELLDFGIFSNVNHHKDDSLGFQIIKSRNQNKANLEIELPYSKKKTSIEKLTTLLHHLNKDLRLNFRDKEQIEFTVNKLVGNLFDDKFHDSEWTLKHSHHTYKWSGATKKIFENQSEETFRATGISILFPDMIGNLNGWEEYNENMFSQILRYFNDEEFQLYFKTKEEIFSSIILEIGLTSIELSTIFDITQIIKEEKDIDFHFLLKGDKSSLTIEFEPNGNSFNKEFTFYLYRVKNEDLEIRLEIDRYANEKFINSLIKSSGIEMEYSHEE